MSGKGKVYADEEPKDRKKMNDVLEEVEVLYRLDRGMRIAVAFR